MARDQATNGPDGGSPDGLAKGSIGDDRLKQLVDRLGGGAGVSNDLSRFATLVYGRSSLDDVDDDDIGVIAGDLPDTLAFITEKPTSRHKLRVRPSRIGTSSVVEILNDDMPFLVDSVMAEIQARNLAVRLVTHPILNMLRDETGRILTAARSDASRVTPKPESLIIVYLPPMTTEAADDLGRALSDILLEVRAAVADWPAMIRRGESALALLEASRAIGVDATSQDALAFLRWMLAGNFVFLGSFERGSDEQSALGLCRDTTIRARLGIPDADSATRPTVMIAKSSVVSRVHRRALMDYVAITLPANGAPGLARQPVEIKFVGLFTSTAYTQTAQNIPLLRRKIAHAVTALGYPPQSHAGKALLNVLDTFPRDELFQISDEDLVAWSKGVLDLDLRPRVRMFVRQDVFNRFMSVLVYAPRDRWNTRVRERIGALLADAFEGQLSAFNLAFPDGPLMRAQFIVSQAGKPLAAVDVAGLEASVERLVRTWDDDLADRLQPLMPDAPHLLARYATAFPPAYAETIAPERAVEDIRRIERLVATSQPVAIDFYRRQDDPPQRVHAAVYRFGDPIRLSERVPLLENLGFTVVDERSFTLAPRLDDAPRPVAFHDMALDLADNQTVDLSSYDQRLEETYLAVDRQAADNDNFNRLVIAAGATWREAQLLRAYAAYLRQLNVPFGMRYLGDTLVRHAGIGHNLLALFRARFDPDGVATTTAEREAAAAPIRAAILASLADVPSLDEDRILRHMLNLVDATLRTNFYRPEAVAAAMPVIALKLDSKSIEASPQPRPFREIWVYTPRVEGVHLRFGPIARGGIRWSDRAQDFRTEVLGLVRAQLVKNAVIIPSGSKGGFLPKQLTRGASRDDAMKEAIATYRIFVSAMLDITDNLVDGQIVPPVRVVRYDGDDPYLVVAADKGTATFSDFANEISAAHGYWLGDAFASGGSAGYDHKKMGITACGAWECVTRHFREMDWDNQTRPFRVSGVGDMSGDVFGNGMLLSPVIELVAAFDHRDIFIDPTPDPAASFAERRRLFDLPRSSWQDYDKSKISAGGGVFSRGAKAIPLSPEIRALLKLEGETCTPAELMRAVLKCPVELVWFGGIGTYVKSSTETDEQVGDRANDSIRVSGLELGAKVVGEGANLGLTQRGRIELAQHGVRLNTDFIDNSAGVNSSDYEVNIKIALGEATRTGRLPASERTSFLEQMTDEVAAGCLKNNRDQALALSLAEQTAVSDMTDHGRLMKDLERRRLLDRRLEALPTEAEFARRQTSGIALSRPELAVLLSYSKIALTDDLLKSQVPESAATMPLLAAYFPKSLTATYPADVQQHRLRREIVATALTNAIINRAGPATPLVIAEETGRTTADIVLAYRGVEQAFGLADLWDRVEELDGHINGSLYLTLMQDLRRLLIQEMRLVASDPHMLANFDQAFASLKASVESLRAAFEAAATEKMREVRDRRLAELIASGVPEAVAGEVTALHLLADAPRLNQLAAASRVDVVAAATTYLRIGERLRFDAIRTRAAVLSLTDPFDRMAVNTALNHLSAAQAAFARSALTAGSAISPDAWLDRQKDRLASAEATLARIAAEPVLTPSRLTVAAAQFAGLADASAPVG